MADTGDVSLWYGVKVTIDILAASFDHQRNQIHYHYLSYLYHFLTLYIDWRQG